MSESKSFWQSKNIFKWWGGGVSVKMTHTLSLYQMDLNTVLKSKSKGNKTPQR